MSKSDEQKSTVLQGRDRQVEDATTSIGAELILGIGRIIKSGRVFSLDHAQTRETVADYAEWLNETMEAFSEPSFSIQLTEHNMFLNGQLVRIPGQKVEMGGYLRNLFLDLGANQIEFTPGLSPGELLELLAAIDAATEAAAEGAALAGFSSPHISVTKVEGGDEEVREESSDERRQLIELYATLLITTRSFFERVRRGGSASSRHVKRVIQRIADELEDHGDIFVGLINLQLMRGRDFVHAAHRAVYSMLLAKAVGLELLDVVRCGMTAIAQDIHQIAEREDLDLEISVGDETHFETNLSSVIALSRVGTQDVLSALRFVTNYERGFPYNKPLPKEWYADELRPHLLSRIVEIARDYDILTQGLVGQEPLEPDMALHAVMNRMGSFYDPMLTKLFVNVLGVFPVGSTVELSTGQTALVVRSCPTSADDSLSRATRPVVRLLDGSEEMIDLSESAHQGIHIERLLSKSELETRPSAFLLF